MFDEVITQHAESELKTAREKRIYQFFPQRTQVFLCFNISLRASIKMSFQHHIQSGNMAFYALFVKGLSA